MSKIIKKNVPSKTSNMPIKTLSKSEIKDKEKLENKKLKTTSVSSSVKVSGKTDDKSVKNVKSSSTKTTLNKIDNKNRTNVSQKNESRTNVKKITTAAEIKNVDKAGKPKLPATTTIRTKPVPMKAIIPVSKNNVMNKIHNVTVSTPPSQRKEISAEIDIENKFRDRTKTRTLEPHEILILKNHKGSNNSSEQTTPRNNDKSEISLDSIETSTSEFPSLLEKEINIPKPVKFEIKFDEIQKSDTIADNKKSDNESEYDDYEDDFESYESDFESERSTTTPEESEQNDPESEEDDPEDVLNNELESQSDDDEDISVPIAKSTTDERKLDSGNYELRAGNSEKFFINNSIDENGSFLSEHDSGLGYTEKLIPSVSPDAKIISTKPLTQLQIRGRDLMKKIILDKMLFSLFELKPMSYEYYMKIYGNLNSIQNSSQTNDDILSQECQTDEKFYKTMWTQYPTQFSKAGLEGINGIAYFNEKNGFGCGGDSGSEWEEIQSNNKSQRISTISIDYDRLNILLQNTLLTISSITDDSKFSTKKLKKSNLKISRGFFTLNLKGIEILDKSQILHIYTNTLVKNLFLTIHKSPDNDFGYENLICVWNIFELNFPMKILSSRSRIICLNIHENLTMIVFAGLADGTLAMWDLRESSHWHPICDGVTVRVPSQIILPDILMGSLEDTGKLVTIKSFINKEKGNLMPHGYHPNQICTLHEIGILTIWTALETKSTYIDSTNTKTIETHINISPWSKIRLIQNSILDFRPLFEEKTKQSKSNFQKTHSYFENDIFSDKILKELQGNDKNFNEKLLLVKNLKFTTLEICDSGFFIGLNKNFIYFVERTLKLDNCKKIEIDEKFLSTTELKKFYNDKFFTVGLSDGSIKIFSCLLNDQSGGDSYRSGDSPPIENEPISSTSSSIQMDQFGIPLKSCTIQNLIKNERPLYENQQAQNNLDSREYIKSLSTSSIHDQQFFKEILNFNKNSKLNNDQILLHNFSSRNEFVRRIFITRNENFLFSLIGETLKFYNLRKMNEIDDLYVDGETEQSERNLIRDMGYIENSDDFNDDGKKFLILIINNNVEIHEINDKIYFDV